MSLYGYDYFCGANVTVDVEGFTILECAGVSYQITEGKVPIYGYSSRHYDAISRGQVIVQGNILINYVHQDYLFRAIEFKLNKSADLLKNRAISPAGELAKILDQGRDDRTLELAIREELVKDYPANFQLAEALKANIWDAGLVSPSNPMLRDTFNPHDMFGNTSIKIIFGMRNSSDMQHGLTGILISGVEFTGRGVAITIDEEVIVEEYPFIARNVHSIRNTHFARVEADSANAEAAVALTEQTKQELRAEDVIP